MKTSTDPTLPEVIISPKTSSRVLDWRELSAYRDLLYFMIWKQIRVRYAQSVLGISWAIIQPVFSMVVFTVIFGKFAKLDSEGAPYALFSLAALLPWTFFSNAITEGVSSLVNDADVMRKVYFPRIILPITAVGSKLVDFMISCVIMILLMIWFRVPPSSSMLLLPFALLNMVLAALGSTVWLTALALQYRDVRYAMNFVTQILMYASPVVYSVSVIPDKYLMIYSINPMVSVIEIFRTAILGSSAFRWDIYLIGTLSSVVLLISGLLFFNSKESIFTDVS